jgi:1-deoxy-D-xylulose-5-phosphate synthase
MDRNDQEAPVTLLETVYRPRDLDQLSIEQLEQLAGEIREFLIESVSRTGGHLGPNLGVVELTIGLHRVFDSPRDTILWDTGHQSYVHKLLTGRQDFSKLKQDGGISGYPSRAESEHDVCENSHASTSLSYADGIAKAYQVRGQTDRRVVGVIGDGALTGGMAWEALNNIACAKDRPVVIVVNDNERSYSPTIGGLADHLATLRTTQGYERFLDWGKGTLARTPVVGGAIYEALHGMKKGLKDIVTPQGMFEDLGLKYIGPIDGHDIAEVESALRRAKGFGGPVIVHCITRKGEGYQPALDDEADHFHGIGVINPETGLPFQIQGTSWTDVFGDEMLKVGNEREDVVAVTAAMLQPVGLKKFAEAYPERIYDVGIAEQHAATSAAGLAFGGLHPVVALYATFLNRCFDQVLMDVALHKAGVTFVLDRAGITGDDGASHNGMWDMSILQVVPGLRIAAPRDPSQVRAQLREALEVHDAPTVVRFSKGLAGPEIEAVEQVDGMDVLRRASGAQVLLVTAGPMAAQGLEAAALLEAEGIEVTVVDPRWVKPVNPALVDMARRHKAVVTVEDNGRVGGVGMAVAQAMQDAGVDRPVRVLGIAQEFLEHGKRANILERLGLTAEGIAAAVRGVASAGER